MDTISLGRYNQLEIIKEVEFGLYLDGGIAGEILLPKRYMPDHYEIGEKIHVFIYLDNEERLVATTQQPLAQVGEFAYLSVSWVNEYGAFLNWGLMKDLFCPFREQKVKMETGKKYIVYICVDPESYRIVSTTRIERYLNDNPPEYDKEQEVSLLIWKKTDMGFKVIIDNQYQGLIYNDQIFKTIHIGDRIKGYIQNVRPDGKIDVSLQPTGRKQITDIAAILLDYLKAHNGYCEVDDNSTAEEIRHHFQVSKKVYKKAIGELYRQRLIAIKSDGIHLI